MLMYEVRREPEMRREVSQLQRWEGRGRLAVGRLNVWVVELHEHAIVSSRDVFILTVHPLPGEHRSDTDADALEAEVLFVHCRS